MFRIVLWWCLSVSVWADKPDLMLLKSYEGQSVEGWVMSEKFDGVRAYWDGRQLISRGGQVLSVPAGFTQGFPDFALDGELWLARGEFQRTQSIVMQQEPHDAWYELTYQVFEVPNQSGDLLARLAVLSDYLKGHKAPFLQMIEQRPVQSSDGLKAYLNEVLSKGGEGLVVRNPNTPYQTGRLSSALKVKLKQDDECEVVSYRAGKGKFVGLVGALECRWNGRVFGLGSGLSDAQRNDPPKMGARVTFEYQGLTQSGKPRHPVFLRERRMD